jgi:hypothetical protein
MTLPPTPPAAPTPSVAAPAPTATAAAPVAMPSGTAPAVTPASTAKPEPPPLTPAEKAKRLEEAQSTFDALYGDTIRRVKTAREALDLAPTLVVAAKNAGAKGQPEMLALIAQAAADLVAKIPDGFPIAIEALQLVVDKAPDQRTAALEGLSNVLQTVYARSHGPDHDKAAERLIDVLVTLGDDRVDAGDYVRAAAAYRRAQDAATAVKSSSLPSIQVKYQAATARQAVVVQIDRLARVLESNPDDAASRDEIIRLTLTEHDSPERAAKYLDLKSDAVESKLILLAGMTPGNLPETACLQLGEWYAGLADQGSTPARLSMLIRARTYYSVYLGKHTDPDPAKVQATAALRVIEDRINKLSPKARIPAGAVLILTFDRSTVGDQGGGHFIMRDLSPQGNTGVLHGGQISKGLVGEAMTFDGTHDYVDCGNKPSLQITGDMTISFWLLRSTATPTGRQAILSKSFVAEGAIVLESGGLLGYWYGRTSAAGSMSAGFPTAAPIEAGAWTHVVLVRDFTNNRLLWYKNGKKTDEGKTPFAGVTASQSPLTIGAGFNGAGMLAGRLDELAIFGRALTEKEVQILYDMGQKGASLSGK